MPRPFIGLNITKMKSTMGGALKQKLREIERPSNAFGYDVGWPRSSRYQRPMGGTVQTSRVAMWMEFGFRNSRTGKHVKARPFFRPADQAFIPTLRTLLIEAKRRNPSERPERHDLERIGRLHADRVKREIMLGKKGGIPNTKVTIEKKGHPVTLFDTGQLHDDLTHDVVEKI